jgi:uncharacterized surface protein with fasciclin (FAS1) repeats
MKNTIATYLEGSLYYTTFMRLVKFSELYPILHEGTNLTVFALPNSAFEKMGESSFQELINRNRLTLKNALTYHIVASGYQASRLIDGARIQTLSGEVISIYHREGILKINNSLVIQPNKRLQNGVVHVIDSMLQSISAPANYLPN